MTVQELATMLEPIPAAQMAAFLQRGQLLTKRQELESKISNIRAQQAKANEEFAAQIQSIEGEISNTQKEIDALGG